MPTSKKQDKLLDDLLAEAGLNDELNQPDDLPERLVELMNKSRRQLSNDEITEYMELLRDHIRNKEDE